MDRSFERKRWTLLIIGTVVLMFAGLIYAWSVLSTPLYGLGWTDTAITFNYTLTGIFFAVGGVVSGLLSKRIAVRARLLLSAALMTGGFWIASTLDRGDDIVKLYLAYGFMAGLAIGIVYNAVISAVNLWFPDRSGTSSGLMLAGFGLGSFFISLIAGRLMAGGVMGWRMVYRVLGSISGFVLLVGALTVAPPSADVRLPAARSGSEMRTSVYSFRPGEMVKTSTFWLLVVLFSFLAGLGNCVMASSRQIILSVNVAEGTAILISSLVSITNTVGRLSAGAIIDRFGLRAARIFSTALAIVSCLVISTGLLAASAPLCTAGFFILGFTYGFPGTLTSATALDYFGPDNYSLNYSIINSDSAICALFPTVFTGISVAGGSYLHGFVFLIAMGVIALLSAILIRRPVPRTAPSNGG